MSAPATLTRVITTASPVRLPELLPARLPTTRGEFAVLDVPPAAGVPVRGTVLLLPGYTGSKEDFTLVLEPLAARGYRAVAVDGRGQHASDGPADDESAYAQDELAKDVLAQARAFDAPVHLVGHSMGGQIARAGRPAGPLAVPLADAGLLGRRARVRLAGAADHAAAGRARGDVDAKSAGRRSWRWARRRKWAAPYGGSEARSSFGNAG
ncbi:2-succinyl-6-hydroxy-2,4-cyclohexadiene-1-carboxylate synthase [Streptomyces griseoloalbus]